MQNIILINQIYKGEMLLWNRKFNVINPVAFSYGYDHLRFIRPVFIGDTIHTKVTIHNKEDHKKNPNMGIITERLEVINQNDETVLVADHLLMCQKKAAL